MATHNDTSHSQRRRAARASDGTKARARELRNSMSKPEVLLWTRLARRQTGFSFRRQKAMGPYVADFYCHSVLLVIEVDGRCHDRRGDEDRRRDAWMRSNGYEVLRLPAADVLRDLNGAARLVAGHCRRLATKLEGHDPP